MNIRHIAEKAGVSVATVSRVMNHPETVAEATRKKIEDIIREEEYTPNWFARGLNFNKTGSIALLVPNILNPAPIEVARGVEDVAHSKGYTILMCNAENDIEKERRYMQQLVHRHIDGIVMIHPYLEEKDFKILEDNKIPSVVIGENSDVSNVHMVRIDSTDAAARVVEHFVNIGYKSIGMLCGRTPLAENRHKLEGFRQAIVDFGLDLKPEHIVYAPNTIEGGYIGARKFFEMKERPEAILATSDTLAFGVIDAAADSGLSIPSDIALVGFDNIRMSNLVTPKLTTMEKPLHKMGVMGARLLFDFIEGEDDAFGSTKKEILLLPKLKIRKSCGHKERIGEMF